MHLFWHSNSKPLFKRRHSYYRFRSNFDRFSNRIAFLSLLNILLSLGRRIAFRLKMGTCFIRLKAFTGLVRVLIWSFVNFSAERNQTKLSRFLLLRGHSQVTCNLWFLLRWTDWFESLGVSTGSSYFFKGSKLLLSCLVLRRLIKVLFEIIWHVVWRLSDGSSVLSMINFNDTGFTFILSWFLR